MDFFDERILNVLKDGKPRVFNQILNDVGFSHNTLRLHLDFLVDQGFIVKEKKPSKGLGRPAFTYSIPPKVKRQVSLALSDPFTEVVSITFSRLRHLCRFEKGGYCKNMRTKCEAQICPQIIKGE
jgi:predicted ArsR family transcriptional regulator